MSFRRPGSRCRAPIWLGNAKAVTELAQAQIVVQLGSSLTGKRLLQWQATCEPEEYWLVDRWKGGSTRRTTAVVVWSAVLTPGWSCIRLKNASPGRWHPGPFAPGVGTDQSAL
jgi:2-succinyl-5-enolpyruvyl-6-hydroxy-3-cyclohexene-1-carboxylate synthase